MRHTKIEYIKPYLEKYPDAPTLTLAKKIYSENPEIFTTLETARAALRYHRGQTGNKNRSKLLSHEFVKEEGTRNPFENIPDGLTYFDEWSPVNIEDNFSLVLADIHIPYHDKTALVSALQYGLDVGVDSILLLGDCVDFFSLSDFVKDPRKRNFKQERSIYKQIMQSIREIFPDINIYYKIGNHEERYLRYMAVKAPELIDEEIFSIDNLLCSEKFKLNIVTDRKIIKFGSLNCIHGHELGRSVFSPVNPARGLYLKGKENAVAGHWHQSSYHPERSMNGTVTACWSVGCICDLHPEYLPINKWNHGFCTIEKTGRGDDFKVENKTIIDGIIY